MAKFVPKDFIVDSSAAFWRNAQFDSSVYLRGVNHINVTAVTPSTSNTPYALITEGTGAEETLVYRQLGSMAWETSTNYRGKAYIDSQDAAFDSSMYTQVIQLDQSFDSSVTAYADTQDAAFDSSMLTYVDLQDATFDSSMLTYVNDYNQIQDGSISKNWDRWIDSERQGFVDNTETTLNFNDSTGVLTLTDAGSGWSYYRGGVKYTIAGNKIATLSGGGSATADTYFFYINDGLGTLNVSTTPWSTLSGDIPVAYIIWDNANSPKYHMGDERHTMLIDRQMHYYLHTTRGTQYVAGGALSGYTVEGTDSSANAIGVSATTIADEDLFLTLGALAKPEDPGGSDTNTYNVFFRDSISTWDWKLQDLPYAYQTAGFIQYDNAGTLTQGQSNKYYTSYMAFTDQPGGVGRYTFFPGRGEFDTIDDALAEQVATFDFTGLPVTEWVIAWQFIWDASSSLSTIGQVTLAQEPVRIEVNSTSASTPATTDHNNLLGLQGGNASERYHLSSAQYNDFVGQSYVDSSLVSRDASITKLFADKVDLAGDTMTGKLTFDSTGFGLDSATITTIDTSADGISQLDTAVPTSGAVKSLVDSAIATGVTASNGLTEIGGDIRLGGLITQDTSIRPTSVGNQDFFIGKQGGEFGTVGIAGYNIDLRATSGGGGDFTLYTNDASITTTNNRGLKYTGNYESTFVARSLITKAYADSLIAGSSTAFYSYIDTQDAAFDSSMLTYVDTQDAAFDSSMLTYVDIADAAFDSSMRTFVAIADAAFDSSMRTFVAIADAAFDSSMLVYVDGQDAAFDSSMLVYVDGQDAAFDSSMLTYVDTQDAAFDSSMNVYVDLQDAAFDSSMLTYVDDYNAIQDISILAIEASAGNYLPLTGGTLTGPLTLSGATSNLSVDGSAIFNGNSIFNGNAYFDGSVYITDVETIDVSSAFIHLNTGLTGAPPANLQSGIIVGRGTSEPYALIYDETYQTFRIGVSQETSTGYLDASTQAVATREDTPDASGVGYWNADAYRIDTHSGFKYDPAVGLILTTSAQNSEFTSLMVNNDGVVGRRELGTGAFATIADYATIALVQSFDSSITTYADVQDAAFDSSMLTYVDTENAAFDSSLTTYVDTQDAAFDSSMLTYVDTQDAAFDSSMLTYVDTENAAFDSSMSTYVDLQDVAFDSSMSTYVDLQDATFDSSMLTYVDTQDAAFDSSMLTYVNNIPTAGAGWGLTKDGDGSINLGGDTDDVSLYSTSLGSNTFQIGLPGGEYNHIEMAAYGGIYLDANMDTLNPPYYSQVGKFQVRAYDASFHIDSSKGIQYANDYTGYFVDESLVTKRYVDAQVTGGIGAWNGLSETDSSIELGGSLIKDTSVNYDGKFLEFRDGLSYAKFDGSSNFNTMWFESRFDGDDWANLYLSGISGGGVAQLKANGSEGEAGVYLQEDLTRLAYQSNASGNHAYLTMNDGSTVFEDTISSKGIQYGGDYEAQFSDRSLVTKKYADTLIAGSSTALYSYIDTQDALFDTSMGAYVHLQDALFDVSMRTFVNTADAAFDSSMLVYVDGQDAAFDSSMLVYVDGQDAAFDSSMLTYVNDYNAIQDASIILLEGATVKAWNGLWTSGDNSIGIGGRITVDTSIVVPDANYFGIESEDGSLAISMDVPSHSGINIGGPLAGGELTIDMGVVYLRSQQATMALDMSSAGINLYTGVANLTLNDAVGDIAAVFTDGTTTKTGIQYAGEYQGSFVNESLITKRYADSLVAGSSTAFYAYIDQQDAAFDSSMLTYVNTQNATFDSSMLVYVDGQDAAFDSSMLTYVNTQNAAFDSSMSSRVDSSLLLYLPLTGGSLSGDLTLSGGTTDLTVDGSATFNGVAVFNHNVYFDGSVYFTDVETIDVSSAFIHLNTGLTGAPPANLQSGVIVGRGSSDPYAFIYDESNQTFRIGVAQETSTGYLDTDTQAVATREDTPISNGIAVWNDTAKRFDTSVGLTFTGAAGLSTSSGLTLTGLNASTNTYALMAPTATGGVITTRDIKVLDAEMITGAGSSILQNIENETARFKKIVQGAGATITEDASTITIAVTGSAGYVSKYTGTFNGTSGTTLDVSAGVHGLGAGPFTVAVYDGTEMVHLDVQNYASGDVTLTWASGSMSATCKYIISG